MNNTQNLPTLDVIIPCYNDAPTLTRAVNSALAQVECQKVILVNDASTDNSWQLMQELKQQHPEKIQILTLAENSGVSAARNWAVLHSQADLIAFLDADDEYEQNALEVVPTVFQFLPELSTLHLRLIPIDLDEKYSSHPNFEQAWNIVQMIGAGNKIFRRNLFLACGGYPQHSLFRQVGGEDAALIIALTHSTAVGTLFEAQYAGVRNYCRKGMHAERLLNSYLFGQKDAKVTPEALAFAEQTTENIKTNLQLTAKILQHQPVGRRPIHVSFANP